MTKIALCVASEAREAKPHALTQHRTPVLVRSCVSLAISITMDSFMDKMKSPFKGDKDKPTESTPLAGYTSESAKEDLQKANAYAVEKAKELRVMAREGDFSIRIFALLGGLAMCIVSIIGFVNTILHFHFVSAFVEVYTFFLGIVVILLEGTNMPFIKTSVREKVSKYALFLNFVWGRGILFFVAGTLELTQTGLADLIVGTYMCLIGIVYIAVGIQTLKKLQTLRTQLFTPTQLRDKFNSADSDNTGTLTMGQFKVLTDNMGLDFNRRETEAVFMSMDKDNNDVLTFEEFENWWINFDESYSDPRSLPPLQSI